jgi:hypothetical protein
MAQMQAAAAAHLAGFASSADDSRANELRAMGDMASIIQALFGHATLLALITGANGRSGGEKLCLKVEVTLIQDAQNLSA